jgi:hypothetical protein
VAQDWGNFAVITGSAAGALTGLLFVAVSLAAAAGAIAATAPAGLALLRGPGGLVSIGVPAGSAVPLILTAGLGCTLARGAPRSARGRRSRPGPSVT